MTWDFSNVGRIVKIIGGAIFSIGLGYLIIWSLGETERFSTLIVPQGYSIWLALVISFSPLVCFGMAQVAESPKMRRVLYTAGISANLIDFMTNVAAFHVWFQIVATDQSMQNYFSYGGNVPREILGIAYFFGMFVCFAVTWAEEIVSYILSWLAELVFETFPFAPEWLATDAVRDALRGASGAGMFESQTRRVEPTAPNQPVREVRTPAPEVVHFPSNPHLTTRRNSPRRAAGGRKQ